MEYCNWFVTREFIDKPIHLVPNIYSRNKKLIFNEKTRKNKINVRLQTLKSQHGMAVENQPCISTNDQYAD